MRFPRVGPPRARRWLLIGVGVCGLAARSAAAAPALELPPASTYGQRVPTRLLCDPVAWPRPVDGALCDAARLLARKAADSIHGPGNPQPGDLEQDLLARWAPFLTLRQGVPDPRVHAFFVRDARWGVVYDELEVAARKVGAGHRIGVGIAPASGGALGVLLAIESLVQVAPFPRRPARGSTPTLGGHLAAGVSAREALLQGPDGKTRTLELAKTRSPGRFRVRLPRLEATGQYRFQLIVERGNGPEIGLLAPLLVEAPEPVEPPASAANASVDADLPLAEQAHLLLADLRSREGLARLERERVLDRAALDRARTMAAERRVVHEPRDGRNAGRLLEAAGFKHRFLAEDVALGPTVGLAFESLLRSPAHRGALLEVRADRVGMGAVATEDGVYLAVLLAGVKPRGLATPLAREIDRQRALLELFQAIQRERRKAQVRPSRRDPDLDGVAQSLVKQLAASGKTRDPGATAKAKALLADREPRPRGAFVDVVVAPEVVQAANAPAALHPDCRELGLGAAAGQRGGLEQAWIVLLCLTDD